MSDHEFEKLLLLVARVCIKLHPLSTDFEDKDFADYDHLNDLGAKKLAEILEKEL